MKLSTWLAVLAPLLAASTGCTATGTGFGSAPSGGSEVRFSWKSSDPVTGTIDATLSDGDTFSGTFFQITSDTQVDTLGPLWYGWGPRGYYRGEWALWDSGPDFIKHYSGKVAANLAASDGKHMRCMFRLIHPASGMSGGGQGHCQLPDGKTIEAIFPRA